LLESEKAAARAVGITDADVNVIKYYTSDAYETINKVRRGETAIFNEGRDRFFKAEVEHLEKSLAKLPPTKDTTLYRSESFNPKRWKNYTTQKEITVGNFYSTANSKESSFFSGQFDNVNSERVRLLITPKAKLSRAKNINDFSQMKRELEVLYLPDTKFKITKVDKKLRRVWLQEQ